MPNIECEMHKLGATFREDGEFVMSAEWEEDAAGEDALHYYLIDFSVFHPSYSGPSTISYGNVLLTPPVGKTLSMERDVYCDGDYIGKARCAWFIYDVVLSLEDYYGRKGE